MCEKMYYFAQRQDSKRQVPTASRVDHFLLSTPHRRYWAEGGLRTIVSSGLQEMPTSAERSSVRFGILNENDRFSLTQWIKKWRDFLKIQGNRNILSRLWSLRKYRGESITWPKYWYYKAFWCRYVLKTRSPRERTAVHLFSMRAYCQKAKLISPGCCWSA